MYRPPLTRAETRLLPYLATHLTGRQIAAVLVLSPATVKTEIRSIYLKLGATGRHEAVMTARARGLLPASAAWWAA